MKPYYEQDGISIYCGNSLEILPDIQADCFFADPPYGVNLEARTTKHSICIDSYTMIDDTPEYVEQVCVPIIQHAIKYIGRGAVTSGTRNLWKYPPADDIGV